MPKYRVSTSPYEAVFDDRNPILDGLGNLSSSIINASSRSLDRKQASDAALAAMQEKQREFTARLSGQSDALAERKSHDAETVRQGDEEHARRNRADIGSGILNVAKLLGFGRGQASQPRTTPKPMSDAEALRAAIMQAKAEAGPSGRIKPGRIAELRKQYSAGDGQDDGGDGAPAAPDGAPAPDAAPQSSPGHPAVSTAGPPAALGGSSQPPAASSGILETLGRLMGGGIGAFGGWDAKQPEQSSAAVPSAAPTAPAAGAAPQSKGTVTTAHLQAAVKAGAFPSLEAAAADAQHNGFTVAPP